MSQISIVPLDSFYEESFPLGCAIPKKSRGALMRLLRATRLSYMTSREWAQAVVLKEESQRFRLQEGQCLNCTYKECEHNTILPRFFDPQLQHTHEQKKFHGLSFAELILTPERRKGWQAKGVDVHPDVSCDQGAWLRFQVHKAEASRYARVDVGYEEGLPLLLRVWGDNGLCHSRASLPPNQRIIETTVVTAIDQLIAY